MGNTKSKMIRLLSKKNMTLSELSVTLGLATSTISKHLEELKETEATRRVENSHIKKWKYYTARPSGFAIGLSFS